MMSPKANNTHSPLGTFSPVDPFLAAVPLCLSLAPLNQGSPRKGMDDLEAEQWPQARAPTGSPILLLPGDSEAPTSPAPAALASTQQARQAGTLEAEAAAEAASDSALAAFASCGLEAEDVAEAARMRPPRRKQRRRSASEALASPAAASASPHVRLEAIALAEVDSAAHEG